MEYTLGQNFTTLTQRILYAYPASYPIFKEVDCGISKDSQKVFYEFMKDVLLSIYENSEKLGFAIYPDEYFEQNQMVNTNTELMKKIEKIENKFISIIFSLIQIGQEGKIIDDKLFLSVESKVINKSIKDLFLLVGINLEKNNEGYLLSYSNNDLFEAWVKYVKEDNAESIKIDRVISFIYAKYYKIIYSGVDFFKNLIKDLQPIEKLENYFSQNGFECVNYILKGKTRYVCTKWFKEYSNGQNTSFCIIFNPRIKNQIKLEFHLPNFRLFLDQQFSLLDLEMRKFIFNRLNNCSDCGYCTQTDKSGKKQKLAKLFEIDGESKLKCPLFPNFVFSEINMDEFSKMEILLTKTENVV